MSVRQGNVIIAGGNSVTVDQTLDINSPNAIANSAVTAGLNGKEPTITGAATTITTNNLAAARAVITDANGKVAASTVTSTELGYMHGVTSAVQTQLNNKEATITGAATTITGSDLTSSRAVISNASGKIDVSSTTSTELGYVHGVTSDIQTQLDNKADTSLSNLTSTGANIGNWSSNVANCVTSIPQDIKVELSNGALTLKAGSKIYVPNGSGIFNEMVISNDLTIASSVGHSPTLLLVKADGTGIVLENETECVSGSTDPLGGTPYHTWYDTANNVIKRYGAGGTFAYNCAFPVASVARNATKITLVRQVFNGFGFFGSAIFVLPGVKAISPNGKNPDGSLNNILRTVTNVQVMQLASYMVDRICSPLTIDSSGYLSGQNIDSRYWGTVGFLKDLANVYKYYSCWYCVEDNKVHYFDANGIESTPTPVFVGNFDVGSDNRIVKFEIKQVYHALDYNDREFVANQAMPSTKIQTLTVAASGSGYVAPADGYFTLGIVGGFAELVTPKASASANWSTGGWARATIPVAKGETMSLYYGSVGTWQFFNFVFAVGAK